MQASVGRIRLAFPLDLAIENLLLTEAGDTVADARRARLHVALLPLLKSRADVEGLELYNVRIDTRSLVADTRIKGRIDALEAALHGVEWSREVVGIDIASLRGADLIVALSDTAAPEPPTAPSQWVIRATDARLSEVAAAITLPGDSMRLFAKIGDGTLRGGHFDTSQPYYAVRELSLRRSAIAVWLPDSAITALPVVGSDAKQLQAQWGRPSYGVDSLDVKIDTLSYNKSGVLRAALTHLNFREQSGLAVSGLRGSIYMDTTRLEVPVLDFRTPYSRLSARADLDWRALAAGKTQEMMFGLSGTIDHRDVWSIARMLEIPDFDKVYPPEPLQIQAKVAGNVDRLTIHTLQAELPGKLTVKANGTLQHIDNPQTLAGKLQVQAVSGHLDGILRKLAPQVASSFSIPAGTNLKGEISFNPQVYTANLALRSGGGSLAVRGKLAPLTERYTAVIQSRNFPLQRFLPKMGLSPFSGKAQVSGRSFDILSGRASLQAEADIRQFAYTTLDISGLRLKTDIKGRQMEMAFQAETPLIEAEGSLAGSLEQDITLQLRADVARLDLQRLGVTQDTLDLGTQLAADVHTNRNFTDYGVTASLRNNIIMTPERGTTTKDLDLAFASNDRQTTASASAGDLLLELMAAGNVERLTKQTTRFTTLLSSQLEAKELHQEELKAELPEAHFHLTAGTDNPIINILKLQGYSFNSLAIDLRTNTEEGVNGKMKAGLFRNQSLQLDTIALTIAQDTSGIQMRGNVRNYLKRNPNKFTVDMQASLLTHGASAAMKFTDQKGRTGLQLGVEAELQEDGYRLSLFPHEPIIAYRNFTINEDNYLFLGNNRDIKADIDLMADDGTGLQLKSEPIDSVNDITLSVNQLNLAELSNVLPYMPRLSGWLYGDIHVSDNHSTFTAAANIEARQFSYEDIPLGNIGSEIIYFPQEEEGTHQFSAIVSSEQQEVLNCEGTYREEQGGIFDGQADLQQFPLQMLNGFLAGTDVLLRGTADGSIHIGGNVTTPVLDGNIDLNAAHITSDVYGFDFLADERPLQLNASKLVFDQYQLNSAGSDPLILNGEVDMSDFSRIAMNLSMKADNFLLINSERKQQSMVYGKMYTNFLGNVKGTTSSLSVKGKLEVLDRTKMTYILKDSPLTVDERLSDLVKFVNFDEIEEELEEPTAPTASFDMTLGISISDAARFHCDLSGDGQSYADIEGGGDLTMRMTKNGDMRLTGRFTAVNGEMKYALPVIPLKTFKLVNGSYVEFTGDMLNPTLSIQAKERVKAVVTEDDQPRSVAFDVGVSLTKPLNNMGLEFTIEAPEDLTVQNQLAAMSVEQRSKAAVSMMATGMYITDENMTSGGLKANNALNAFLQSEIQNIAGSALKTIDINLGVESGTSSTGTATTDYSFQFSKRFLGDRMSVVVGGKVSTGSDASNTAESLINNIAVEYRLDKSATRYVKVFYDRDTRDPLEGQLTRTGAGVVLRRKSDRLGELFIFRSRK